MLKTLEYPNTYTYSATFLTTVGVSYNEQLQEKPLVKLDDFANLRVGECYTLLPLPEVRVSKMQTPQITRKDKNLGFIEAKELEHLENLSSDLQAQEISATGSDHTDMIDTGRNINPTVYNHNELSVKPAESDTKVKQNSVELQENIKDKQKDITEQWKLELAEPEV